jgi:hypothetical protein
MLGELALACAALPLALVLVNLVSYRRPPLARAPASVSVLIPARDEEANIGAAVAAVLASRGVALDLVVLDDHSTDNTGAILAAVTDDRLRVVSAPSLPPGWSGKQHACAVLATHARHELTVFVDADVRLAPDALARMAGFMERHPAVGLASGFPHEITRGWAEILLLPLIHFVLLGFLPLPVASRSRHPSFAAGCGQLFVARSDAYARAGGHAAIHQSRHDGITLPRAFRRAGVPTALFDATDLAECRMYSSAALLWEGLTKNATEGMATPVALPVWTALLGLGQILPLPMLIAAPSRAWAAALACGIATRLVLAVRFRQSLGGALLHPLSVASLLAIQWASLWRAWRGVPATWRGRAYPPELS